MKIKLLNLNLWRGGILMDRIINFIKKENPDILTLQEVFDGKDDFLPKNFRTMKVFQKELDYKYYFYSPAFIEETEVGLIDNGNLIISRFPFKKQKTFWLEFRYQKRGRGLNHDSYNEKNIKDFLKTPRNLQETQICINGKEINIYNLQGIWGLDGKDNFRRLRMARKIIEIIKNKKNIILAGDFNVNEGTETINLIEKNLFNVFKNELQTTFSMKRKTKIGYARAVVDMIFLSSDFKIVKNYCPKVDISDHLPLIVIFD